MKLANKNIVLILSGSVAALKVATNLVSLLKNAGATVQPILSGGGEKFVKPESLTALTGHVCLTDESLWMDDEAAEMRHIQLSRRADMIVVAPASANMISKIAHGSGEGLAAALLLANNRKPVLVCPAMNTQMWENPAVQRNVAVLRQDGYMILPPAVGDLACGETGPGRLPEPEVILTAIGDYFSNDDIQNKLAGKKVVVTGGPTREYIDPVRYISNDSSGKQAFAIAASLARAGADVTLISGPVNLPDPRDVKTIRIKTAQEMLERVQAEMPCDIAVCAAAVADYRVANAAEHKIKKEAMPAGQTPRIDLVENPDILKTISHLPAGQRPRLVVGFAAESQHVVDNAQSKLKRKGCDWILANNILTHAFGEANNQVTLISADGVVEWPEMTKEGVAHKLTQLIIRHFGM